MQRLTENKIILIVRATRLADLKARFVTKMQARFYVGRLGGDFGDYESEDTAYQGAVNTAAALAESNTCTRVPCLATLTRRPPVAA